MKRWPVVVAVISAAFFIWGATGCAPPTGGNSPVIVGDSIVFGAQVEGYMNRMPNAFIDADPGRGIYIKGLGTNRNGVETVPLALTRLTPGGWLVVELGTNGLETDDPAFYRPNIHDLLQQVPAGVCVAWVTVYNGRTDYTIALSYAFNLAVRELLQKERSCYRVIDWFGEARFRFDLTESKDRLHPTALGKQVLAEMIDNNT
jgi:lysophospholipase L1-like esterase